MITPYQLLQESGFSQYTAMCRFTYNRDNTSLGAEKLAEMVRAIPGSTRVSTVSLDKDKGIAIFNVKLISSKTPKEAFISFKENALKKFRGMLLSVEVGAGTIEKKGDFIVQESKQPLKQTHLGNYLGQLLEEGLLLEVSIEELRRQYVECDPPKISAEIFEQIVQAAENKSNYATWLCKKIVDGLVPVEDLGGWHDLFQFFERYKQRFQTKDINQVKTAENIQNFKQQYEQAKEAVENKKAGGAKKEELDPCQIGTIKTSNGKTWKVYKTGKGQYDLERKIGSGAGWCTVSSEHMFNHYLDRDGGNYYIFVNKENPDKEKYQIHIESNQCANIQNNTPQLAQRFIIQFYEFLKEKEGKEIPERIKRAKEELETVVKSWDEIKNNPPVKDDYPHQDLPSGGKLYRLLASVPNTALLFRDMNIAKDEENLTLAQDIVRRPNCCVLKAHDGTVDLLLKHTHYNGDHIASCLGNEFGTENLPRCTESNLQDYRQAAAGMNATLNRDVEIRNDKDLPTLESFKWKEADTRTGYRFPAGSRVDRALLELQNKANEPFRRNQIENIALNQEVLACIDTNFSGLTIISNGEDYMVPAGWNNSAGNVDRLVKIVKFLGINLDEPQKSQNFKRLHTWLQVGRWQGILEALKNTVDVPGIDSSKIVVANAQKLMPLCQYPVGNECYAVYATGDISKVYIITNGYTYLWSPSNYPVSIYGTCTRQASFTEIQAIKPRDFGTIYQHLGMTPPGPIEKLMGRVKPGDRPSVLQFLRARQDQFQHKSIPLHNYTRGWRAGTSYTVDANGIYGTWEQIGPLIQQSSPDWYNRIVGHLANYQGHRIDAFIYFDHDSPRHAWSCIIRAINPRTNRVDWYVRRYGDGEGVQWMVRTPQPEERALAGDPGEANYVPLEPPQARAPRQRRGQEQPAAPAVPAPEVAPEVREQLNQFRRQSNNSPEAYTIPANRTQELLPALGFTNLNPGQDRNVVVYRAYEHRGQTTYVALIYGNGQTIVAGYPQNPTTAVAAACSQQWRTLTRQLDNSVRTFQQCHDICQELHIALPVAIQGWLVYRGAHQ